MQAYIVAAEGVIVSVHLLGGVVLLDQVIKHARWFPYGAAKA
jgi:hypothetical protein